MQPWVGIIMGSQTDWEVMQHVELTLGVLGIPNEVKVISVHRAPDLVSEYGKTAEQRGMQVIVAGASCAAHLPGMLASHSLLPVLGVPVPSQHLNGLDSLLSIVQMPAGIAVGTLSIGRNGAINAALLAAQIIGRQHPKVYEAVLKFRRGQTQKVIDYPDPRRPA